MLQGDWQVGEIVSVRGGVWRVTTVHHHRDCTALGLEATSRRAGAARTLLVPFDRPTRAEAGWHPVVISRREWWRSLAVAATSSHPWDGLWTAAAADLTVLDYQLEPALAVVRGLASRILLADEVGLGKTIQAGLIASELRARGRADRVLVMTPAGLREQWAAELSRRFGLDAQVVDAAVLRRRRTTLPRGANPWLLDGVHVVSIDFVKRPEVLRALESITWDLAIVDEAHGAAGRSDRRVAADGLCRSARVVTLVTATPHAGDDRAFATLCSLGTLDGDRAPLMMFRRMRHDVARPATRRVRRVLVRPTAAERRMHRLVVRYSEAVCREAWNRHDGAPRLAMIVLRKRALSSAGSLLASVERRRLLLDGRDDAGLQLPLPLEEGETQEEDLEPAALLAAPGLDDAARERQWLGRLAEAARAATIRESKILALHRLLRRTTEPAIVFTEYRDTLIRLDASLPATCTRTLLHGGLTRGARADAERRFNSGDARVLLATDAAGEGLNLQARCRWVIDFEMPWNPVRLEQRLGRVDRLGQRHPVHASRLVAQDTAEAFVLARLDVKLERIDLALRGEADRTGLPGEAAVTEAIVGKAPNETAATGAGTTTPLRVSPTGLEGPATAEAGRQAAIRRVAALGRIDLRSADIGTRGVGPVVTVLRRAGRHKSGAARLPLLIFVFRVPRLDATGQERHADLMAAIHAAAPVRRRPSGGHVEDAVTNALEGMGSAARTLVIRRARARLEADRPAIEAAVSASLVREAALADVARGEVARQIVQPGLFDRRAMHAGDRARIRLEAALSGGERRARRRAAEPAVRVGDAELVVIGWVEGGKRNDHGMVTD